MIIKVLYAAALVCLLALTLAGCATTGGQTQTLTSEDYYRQAQQKMADGDYEDAKASLEEARRHFRAGDVDAGVLALLGDVHFKMEEYSEALGVYGEFLTLHPRNPLSPRVQFQIGMCHLRLISTPDRNPQPAALAQEAFTKVLQYYPQCPEAAEAAANLQIARRALAESEAFVGNFYFRKKYYRGAINRFETILAEYSGTGFEEEALYHLGESFRRLEEVQKAEEYFELLVSRFPAGKYTGEARDFLEKKRG